jgi:hypothetical protein
MTARGLTLTRTARPGPAGTGPIRDAVPAWPVARSLDIRRGSCVADSSLLGGLRHA